MLFLLTGLCCLVFAGIRTWNYLQYRKRRRSRKNQKMDLLTAGLYIAAAVLLLAGLLTMGGWAPEPTEEPPEPSTTAPTTEPPTEPPTVTAAGWVEDDVGRYYSLEDGSRATGWLDLEGRRYWLGAEGYTCTGWQEVEGMTRYFRPDGSMARGREEIDGATRFFTSTGAKVLLVNPWNSVPEGYEAEMKELTAAYSTEGGRVAASIYDDLLAMMNACNEHSGSRCCVLSGYRSYDHQVRIFDDLVWELMNNEGKSEAEARAEAATRIAVPGTSEHQLGLAVDIVDTQLWSLEQAQEDLAAQRWLTEYGWEYGFILRYPKDKTDVTGIIYEPWHYRYVGRELAKELHDLGLTLEEYLDRLD